MPLAHGTLWILLSLQRSGTTWFMREMARSPCVRWEAAVFDKFDDKGPEQWSHAQRRAALEGLKRLADRGEARFDAPGVSEHLRKWTEHTAELMSSHNYTRSPVAVGMKVPRPASSYQHRQKTHIPPLAVDGWVRYGWPDDERGADGDGRSNAPDHHR